MWIRTPTNPGELTLKAKSMSMYVEQNGGSSRHDSFALQYKRVLEYLSRYGIR